jgi:uncharacterized protein YbcI
MDIHQARTEAIQEEMKAKTKIKKKMEAVIGSGQKEMRAMISSIRAKLEESMKHRVEDILESLDHRTQGTQAKI